MIMPVVREETRVLMAQLRRNITSSSRASAMASSAMQTSRAEQKTAIGSLPSSQQQRQLQHVTVESASSPSPSPAISKILRDAQDAELASATPATPSRATTITAACAINGGKQVEVNFENGSKYVFHTSWLKDSAADNFGGSFNRNCPHAAYRARESIATRVNLEDSGAKLCVDFEIAGVSHIHEYDTRWLHAFAPYVAHTSESSGKFVQEHGPLLSQLTTAAHKSPSGLWGCEKEFSQFTCQDLTDNAEEQMRFLEVLATDGAAVVLDLPAPGDLNTDGIGSSLETVINKVVGAMYQPPRRKTNFGIMRANMAALNIGDEEALADYNFENPLSMHTDHAIYEGTPGYLQWNWQAQASVTTKICNGVSVAEHIRETNPSAFKLLSTVLVTHAVRTNHYTFDGNYANSPGRYHDGTFEQNHTHPIIKLDKNNNVVQVIHNELKRGVSAIPFDVYDEFNEAYSLWKGLCEDARFTCEVDWPEHSCVVLNNHFVLHGRATPVPGETGERIMVWGYTRKDIAENRYRLLKQNQLDCKAKISDDYTRNIPNQVLMSLETE